MTDRPLRRPSKPGWYELTDDDRLAYFDGADWSSEQLGETSIDWLGSERAVEVARGWTAEAMRVGEARWSDDVRTILGPMHDRRRELIAEIERNWSDKQYRQHDEKRREVEERRAVAEHQAADRADAPVFVPRQVDWAAVVAEDMAAAEPNVNPRARRRGGLIALAIAAAVVALIAVRASDSGSSSSGDATARCEDGTLSFSMHHEGTCSHHGGVAAWLSGDDGGPDPADLGP